MKGLYNAVVLSTLLGQGVFAANAKLNQYPSMSDCENDRNIISHASPSLWSCHTVDPRTQAVYMTVGDDNAGGYFFWSRDNTCPEDDARQRLNSGKCITLPSGTTGIGKWV